MIVSFHQDKKFFEVQLREENKYTNGKCLATGFFVILACFGSLHLFKVSIMVLIVS